ncbi:MAG: hypothetical protein HYV63_25570 [Candidatus Schekmanbacteria bacterium]|nr:hypothetical protein [Candidatus Schekmanbacteria bacterium]
MAVLALAPAHAKDGAAPPDAGALDTVWWNRPKFVAALGLDEAQRKRMDEHLAPKLAALRKLRAALEKQEKALLDALVKRDWTAARREAAADAETRATLRRVEAGVKVDVFSELTQKQVETVAAKHSGLVTRPWLMSGLSTERD